MAGPEEREKFGVSSVISDLKIVLEYKELSILIFAVFVSMIGFGLVMPFLPIYARDFGATKTHIGLMLGLFSVVKIFVAPIGGKFADMYGRKYIMVGGMFVYMIVMFLFGAARTLPELFIYRASQGAASGLVWPIAMTYIGDVVREEDRGKAMGLYSMAFASGNATGPVLGGLIASYYSLSVPFFFTSGLAAVSGVLLLFGVKESYEGTKSKEGHSRVKKDPFSFLKFDLSKITPHPKTFLGLTVGSFTVFFGLSMVWSMLSLFGDEVLLLSAFQISLIFTLIGVVQVIVMFPAGSLSDRIGRKKLIVAGALISSIFAGVIGLSTGFLFIMVAVGFYTLGRALARPSFPAFVSSLSPIQHRGKMMGIYNFAQNLAFASGSFLGGVVADVMGLRFPYFIALVVGIGGVVFISVTVKEPGRD
ncbi:MAG: MFS transporter [Candidatus Natronoplasma sp.]